MALQYSKEASEIVDFLMVPLYAVTENKTKDYTPRQQKLLEQELAKLKQLEELLQPYKERVEAYYLPINGLSFAHSLYFQLLQQGHRFADVKQFIAGLRQLSQESLRQALILAFGDTDENDVDFMTAVENSDKSPKSKWHWAQAYKYPLKLRNGLADLLEEIAELYEPIYQSGGEARQEFLAQFQAPAFFQKASQLSSAIYQTLEEQEAALYIISPWHACLVIHEGNSARDDSPFVIVAAGIDKVLEEETDLSIEGVTNTLKSLADETRYKVLVELTKPFAKSKDIAKTLDITGAAVSFHTQKLLNAQLLVLNKEDSNIKYDVNQNLLRAVIAKLRDDFEL